MGAAIGAPIPWTQRGAEPSTRPLNELQLVSLGQAEPRSTIIALTTHVALQTSEGVVSIRRGGYTAYVEPMLTFNSVSDFSPHWSPDGRRIAFSSNRDGDHEIFVMRADGSDQRQITFNAAHDDHPAWAPDRTKARDPETSCLPDTAARGDARSH